VGIAIEQMIDDDQIQDRCYSYKFVGEDNIDKMLSPLCKVLK